MQQVIDKQILEIVRAFACNDAAKLIIPKEDNEQLIKLFHRCSQQKLLAMAYDRLDGLVDCNEELRRQWKNEARRELMVQSAKTEVMKALCEKLNEAEIKYFALKGIVCRNMYAHGEVRISADEDISIRPSELDRCKKIFAEFGLEQMYESETDYKYCKKGASFLLELHLELFEEKIFSDIMNMDWDNGFFVTVDGVSIRTLPPTENFIYLMFHALKHFLVGGFGIRTICDVGKFAELYGSKIYWARVKDIAEKTNAFDFICGLLDICANYFGLSYKKACCPEYFRAKFSSKELLQDCLDAGIYGQSTKSRKQSSLITRSAYKNSGMHTIRAVFPGFEYMAGKYPYVKKCPILLPFAWISRIFTYLCSLMKRGSSSSPAESIAIGKKRIRLLEKYGIKMEIFNDIKTDE